MKREVRRIHWYTDDKEKTNDIKVYQGQTYSQSRNQSLQSSVEACRGSGKHQQKSVGLFSDSNIV